MFLDDLKASANKLNESFKRLRLSPEYHPLPAVGQLEMHARFLRKQCAINRSYAKDMVAYYHGYSDWQHLLQGVCQRALPNTRTDVPYLENNEEKQRVYDFINTLPAAVINAMAGYHAEPGTLVRAVLDKRPDLLFDAEIAALYRAFFTDESYTLDTDEIITALLFRDNSILSRLKYLRDNKLTTTNPHIDNYRTGWRTYCYITLSGQNRVEVSIRELDSYIFPSAQLEHFFTTPWHIPYILSHIQQIMHSLRHAGYTGTLTLHRVNNEGLLEYYSRAGKPGLTRYSCAGVPWIDERIAALNLAAIEAGARAVSTPHGCLAFDF